MNKRLKAPLKSLLAECRAWTGPLRKMPDFLMIGTQKGGTSSLFHYVEQHPAVRVSVAKEVHYFDLNYRQGPSWYQGHFPVRWDKRITGEASPFYLFHPRVPERVKQAVPGAKLIILLRDPVERAFSHYRMNVKDGTETLSFEDAVLSEHRRIRDDVERMKSDRLYTGRDYRLFSYINRGFYDEQLKRWLKHFPSEQMLVLKSEELFGNPAPVVERVFRFLGVDPDVPIEYDGRNEGRPGNISPETRARLRAIFAPHNVNLSVIAGPDFCWDDDSLRVPAAG
jgi:Sulfotransferase domain